MNGTFSRILIPLAVILVLYFTGIIDLSLLPWNDPDFQATLATVAVYLIWSVLESSAQANASRITLYAVLLVSVLDSFLLRATVIHGLMALRWAGVFMLTSGSVMRLSSRRSHNEKLLRFGRAGQMTGLALGLGSLAGTAVSLFPGLPSALREKRQ